MPNVSTEDVKFEIGQKVFIDMNGRSDCLPCTPDDISLGFIYSLPDKTWIEYRGLQRIHGEVYMRFLYQTETFYLALSTLECLINVPQVRTWETTKEKVKRRNQNRFRQVQPKWERKVKKVNLFAQQKKKRKKV